MDRFVSNFTNKLDAKGRVSIPAAFRSVLMRDGFEGLYVHPSLDQPTLDCGGHALLADIDALIAPLPLHSDARDSLVLTMLGEGDILKVDGEGRVSLTDALKSHAGILSEVSFVGAGRKFQIWEPTRFRERLSEARRQALALRNHVGSRPVASVEPAPPASGARE